MRLLAPLLLVASVACTDRAEFRPARGVKDFPSTSTAYRIKADPDFSCLSLGYVTQAASIDAIADTVANHGGTHYRVLDDRESVTTETDVVAGQSFGVVHGRASSRLERHHRFVAQAYRCD